ncbi:MAG: phytoene desaturase [Melioribacteraceae bacterium]|nr:phytoene desaturase [Melioribacteraceae bacterium]
MNAAVIGAGLGGLAAAIRLAKMGVEVDLFEQNNFAGGKAGEIVKDGFRFDTGPSLLTMPFVLDDLIEFAGEKRADHFQFEPLEIICKYFYSDKSEIIAYSDADKFCREIENKTIDSAASIRKFLKYSENIYELTKDIFLFSSLAELDTYTNAKAVKTFLKLGSIDPLRNMHSSLKRFFKDPKTLQLFDRYATYNGSNPYKAPATLNVIPHVEYNLGGFLPKGGINQITKSLQKIADNLGVFMHFGTKVLGIEVDNNRVKGVKFRGLRADHVKKFDIVISNSDVLNTYKYLLNDQISAESKKYKNLEPSSSGLVYYWGVKGNYPELAVHNILFSKNYRSEFDQLFDQKKIPLDPTTYIYVSSKLNKNDAPEGFENWFVMINTPYHTDQNWEVEKEIAKERVIDKINNMFGINLRKQIVFEEVLTPDKIQTDTSSSYGSIYGISSNSKSAAFLRQSNKSKKYKGLYFVGGSAHPGGGIPLVLLSAKITSELIKKYEIAGD